MHALLVHPELPRTCWGFQYGLEAIGKHASLPPLGLITVAALLPRAWEVRLCDLNVAPLREDDLRWADAVLVGGMLVQEPSMHEVLVRSRALGRRTIVGGPAASTSPGRFPDADVVFGGEAEGRDAELIALVEGTTPAIVPLRKDLRPDVSSSPLPRFDLLALGAYTTPPRSTCSPRSSPTRRSPSRWSAS